MTDHIRIRPAQGIWVVRAGGAVLAESKNALELHEGEMPPVIYFPRGDVAMAFLEKSGKQSYCPHKGDAAYYGIHAKSGLIEDAAWSYEDPREEVAEIREYLAFYPSKVVIEQI